MASAYSDRDLDLIPNLTFSFVENYIKENKSSSGKKSINKGFKYFTESYIKDIKVEQQLDVCIVTGRCYKSQKRNEEPYRMAIHFNSDISTPNIQTASCTCPIGISAACGHVTGLLYQLAKFKHLGLKALPEDLAKTSQPQTWHAPRGEKIRGKTVQDLEVCSFKYKPEREEKPKLIKSTLYNPIRGQNVDWQNKYQDLSETSPDLLILPALQNYDLPLVNTKFGKFRQGSVLSYQQPLETDCVINLYDGVGFPQLPVSNFMNNTYHTVLTHSQMVRLEGLTLSIQEIQRFEAQTRLQSLTPLWFKIREHRITASKIGEVFKRRKDFEVLSQRLKTKRNFTTAAMRKGLACEPLAAMEYARKLDNRVNLYPCGVLVSLHAPWYAASPDRKVYHPERDPPFGLLEIKCPDVSSVLEVGYLKKDNHGRLALKQNHIYYYQVLTQLAVSGLQWCDFFVWCNHDNHVETIEINVEEWQKVKDKTDEFFFNYYL